MRPLGLHIEGFGVFREPVEISFDGVDYFALVGPTGAGKSTVIDAICFALYGSVPRYGDERLVGRVVSLGKQEAKVSLTFALGERRYRATRVVRIRDGKATTPEAALEDITDDEAPSRLLASRAREMRPAVERLLGLPFAHFTTCVVLPQGDFARFLHDDPASRQKLLANLLGLDVYKEIGQRARERAAAAKQAIELHERQLADVAFATDDARRGAHARRTELRTFYKDVEAARADDERWAAAEHAAEARAAKANTLTGLLARVVAPDGIDALASAIADARADRETAAAAVVDAQANLAALDATVEALPDQADLLRARDAHTALEQLHARAAQIVQELEAATDAVARANERDAEANEALTAAQAALAGARDQHAAHALAGHLVAGAPCPVCAQTVATVPKRKRPAALSGAERALTSAAKAADTARADAERVRGRQTAVATRAEAIKEQLDELTATLADHPDRDALDAALLEIEGVRARHTDARKRDQDARTRATAAVASERAAVEQTADATRALGAQREELLRAGLEPPAVGDDLAHAWPTFVEWARTVREQQEQSAADASADASNARSARRVALDVLRARTLELGIDGVGGDLGALAASVVDEGTHAATELRRIEEAIDTARKAREQANAAREEHEVADLLATQLRADRFEKWLLVEALEMLVERASQTLVALSDGQYSLRYSTDEEFLVVDHRNADATRSVRTLSGGETFQASLALALALSDQLAALTAGGGAKLDAIFLDEGFGTLDADALETVATTIEALGTTGRMVGVVTHVPALAERVPVRFRVTRHAQTAEITREDL